MFPVHVVNIRERVSLANPRTAQKLAKAFLPESNVAEGQGKVVIEAFPGENHALRTLPNFVPHPSQGPGALSRALIELPPTVMKKLIILENFEPYLEYLRVGLPSCIQ